jgi:hypothetical protein
LRIEENTLAFGAAVASPFCSADPAGSTSPDFGEKCRMTGRVLRGNVAEVLRSAIRDLEESAVLVRKVVLAGLDLLGGGGEVVAGGEAVCGVLVSFFTAGDVFSVLVSTFGRSSGLVGGFLVTPIVEIALSLLEAIFVSLFLFSASNFFSGAFFSSAA